jgi:SAM-dependent methyltransferase
MQMSCPSCKSDKIKAVKNHFTLPTLRCKNCNLDYVDEIPLSLEQVGMSEIKSTSTDAELIASYSKNIESDIKIAKKSLSKRISIFEKIAERKILSVCEIGCSAGVAYEFFRDNKIDWIGLETDSKWINYGERMSIPIFGLDLKDVDKKFDLIYFHQVLEHILEPQDFMRTIYSHLNEGGIVFIGVPNHGGFTALFRRVFYWFYKDNFGMLQYPYHLRAYSPKSLNQLLKNSGFSNVDARGINHLDSIWGEWYSNHVPLKNRIIFFVGAIFGFGSLLIGIGKK